MTFVEHCLYEYKENKASLEAMRFEISDLKSVHGQNYDGHVINGVSDPVGDVTARIIALEGRIARIERKVRGVERLRDDLKGSDLRYSQMRQILELKYINHEDNIEVQETIAISVSTFWRRVHDLLHIARKYFSHTAT